MYYFSPCCDQVHDKQRKGGRVYFYTQFNGCGVHGEEGMVAEALGQEVLQPHLAGAQLTYVHALSFSDVLWFVVCVCLHVCICTIMRIPTEARRGCWIWSWIYRQL